MVTFIKLKHLIVTASVITIIGVSIFQITNFNFNDNKELQKKNMNDLKFSNVQTSIKNDDSIIVESLPVPDTSVEIEASYLN